MINGIIFQKFKDRKYKGVEGDNWYLNDIYPELFEEYFEEEIERSWCDFDSVDVCNNMEFIKKYIDLSLKNNIKFQIILCETNKSYPVMEDIYEKYDFIGYDYAYSGGSYYSAIYNDICSERIKEFSNIRLNENGLFDNVKELKDFILKRQKYEKICKNNVLEKGDFIVYKLYKVII